MPDIPSEDAAMLLVFYVGDDEQLNSLAETCSKVQTAYLRKLV